MEKIMPPKIVSKTLVQKGRQKMAPENGLRTWISKNASKMGNLKMVYNFF